MATLTPNEIRLLRLRSQRLHPDQAGDDSSVASTVRQLVGLQAQERSASVLSIRARSNGLTHDDVGDAYDARTIIRTWCMRGTIHLLAAKDAGWMLPLFGPTFIRKTQRRYRELGIDDPTGAAGVDAIRGMLVADAPLTRAEIAARLTEQGIPSEGQATYHLLRRAALEGIICFGPDRAGDETYVLLDAWIETAPPDDQDEAMARLARAYFAAYGPADLDDFATWSGLGKRDARAALGAIHESLITIDVGEARLWLPEDRADWLDAPPSDDPIVNLLPAYDTYLLGYKGRELIVAAEFAKHVHPGGGVIRPTLLVNGQAAGIWRREGRRDSIRVTVETFGSVSDDVVAGLQREAEDMGYFLDTQSQLLVQPVA